MRSMHKFTPLRPAIEVGIKPYDRRWAAWSWCQNRCDRTPNCNTAALVDRTDLRRSSTCTLYREDASRADFIRWTNPNSQRVFFCADSAPARQTSTTSSGSNLAGDIAVRSPPRAVSSPSRAVGSPSPAVGSPSPYGSATRQSTPPHLFHLQWVSSLRTAHYSLHAPLQCVPPAYVGYPRYVGYPLLGGHAASLAC